jgi:DNA polymerase-1
MHNAVFDLGFLVTLGLQPGAVRCTMLLSQMLYGSRKAKGFHGLEKTVERELGRAISKAEQKSDWSAASLSREQLEYAASDAELLVPLHDALMKKLAAAGQARVALVESRCLPAMAWVSRSGVPFDKDPWLSLAAQSAERAEALAQRLDESAPNRPGYLPGSRWNWRSQPQVKEVFHPLGVELESTDEDALAAVDHPLAGALREYRAADKEVTSYGSEWMRFVAADGRLHAEWRQLGCITGRMSCKNPALQTIPKADARRNCFRAPDGRVLVQALGLLWERRAECPGAFPVLIVHDEIVVECDREQAGAVSDWLRQGMLDGMAPLIEPVPVEVEIKASHTWGGE